MQFLDTVFIYYPQVTKVVLGKGWRCLDCTVCEGCGERNDEARLVLCEDCDISYHIYCMNPPLDHVPSGVWRCKWCVLFVQGFVVHGNIPFAVT